MCMVTKTLTIMEDAYNLLAARKLAHESFSQEIRRVMGVRQMKTMWDFAGLLSEEEGDEVLRVIEKRRVMSRKSRQEKMKAWE